MVQNSNIIADHIQGTAKVFVGGGAVGGGTYVAVDSIANATQIAGFAAAVATTLYFLAQFGYVIWKWYREANGKA